MYISIELLIVVTLLKQVSGMKLVQNRSPCLSLKYLVSNRKILDEFCEQWAQIQIYAYSMVPENTSHVPLIFAWFLIREISKWQNRK